MTKLIHEFIFFVSAHGFMMWSPNKIFRKQIHLQSDAHTLPQRAWNDPPQTKSPYILKQGDANTDKDSLLRNKPKELTQSLFFKCESWLGSDAKKYFCLLMKGQASQSVKYLSRSELRYHHQTQISKCSRSRGDGRSRVPRGQPGTHTWGQTTPCKEVRLLV